MFKSITLSLFICLCILQASAQMPPANVPLTPYKGSLPMTPYVAKAFDNGTRNLNGKPGKNYWQNHARYNIAITVNPPQSMVKGVEHITYYNNSPDKLDSLNMKLIVNSHRRSNPDAGIQVDDIKVNGMPGVWDNKKVSETNYMMPIPKPVMPHDSVKLDITWHYLMLKGRGRESMIDSTTFYIAYFYPRVSVYDDYKHWDTQPFAGLEFYNDFNDYTLSVTVPDNFIVWATGDLQNAKQVLQPETEKKYQLSLTNDSTIHVASAQDLASKTVTAHNPTNTWVFTSTNITDVAVAVSNHYDWDAGSVITDDKTGRRVSMQAAFPDVSKDFHRSVQNGRYSLRWFSQNWPGVQYPFPKSIAVQGFADMEFPMMMNDSHQPDTSMAFAELVQDHEQAHTYMPFYMGTNESFYAFMDEGWATTFEYLIGMTEKGKKGADDFYKQFRVTRWIHAPHDKEQPIITPSPYLPGRGGDNAYGKPSLSYLALKDMLGDELFKKALHTYMDNWHGKHPIPWDYFNSMMAGSGKDLKWFFNNWFFTPSYCDLGIAGAKEVKGGYDFEIKNIGGFAIPFDVVVTYTDGTTGTFHQTPAVWEKDQKATVVHITTGNSVKSATLDNGIYMDANDKDNTRTAQ